MLVTQITLINKLGLHARAASKLVSEASRFASQIQIAVAKTDSSTDTNSPVDAKSIMSVMMLAASCGTTLELSIDGSDAESAQKALHTLINNRFDEPE